MTHVSTQDWVRSAKQCWLRWWHPLGDHTWAQSRRNNSHSRNNGWGRGERGVWKEVRHEGTHRDAEELRVSLHCTADVDIRGCGYLGIEPLDQTLNLWCQVSVRMGMPVRPYPKHLGQSRQAPNQGASTVCFPVAMTKHWPKVTWEGARLFQLTLPCRSLSLMYWWAADEKSQWLALLLATGILTAGLCSLLLPGVFSYNKLKFTHCFLFY